MRSFVLTFLILASLSAFGQEDHLLPTGDFFNLYSHERDYYPYVYKHLFKDLSDTPLARVITLPSFSPESVLSVENVDRGKASYKLIYIIGKESIWYKKNRNTLDVTRYEEPIDTILVNIIRSVFKEATAQVKYLSDDSWSAGLDGVTYIFTTFVVGQGNRSGEVWSPDEGTKMNQLIEFAQALIKLAQADNDYDRLTFKKEIRKKGETLLVDLNAR